MKRQVEEKIAPRTSWVALCTLGGGNLVGWRCGWRQAVWHMPKVHMITRSKKEILGLPLRRIRASRSRRCKAANPEAAAA